MEHQTTTMAADSTVRSQDSNNSSDSKDTKISKISESTQLSKDSKSESCHESKHSKEVLIDSKHQDRHQHQNHQQPQKPKVQQEAKDDSNILMFTSCGQLLLGVVLVVFGVLVLVHGASLGGSGAGLWAGAGALVAGALGVVATLATTSSSRQSSGFSSAHLASSLVALALSNMAAITALTAVVRDAQRAAPDAETIALLENEEVEVGEGWAGLLDSIGLLVASVAELFVSGYTSATLAPKLCSCLRPSNEEVETMTVDGKTLKARNMVHQWVIAQNHVPKNPPIYVVQPLVPVHPLMQGPYGIHPAPGKFAGGFLRSPACNPAYGTVPMLPAHMAYSTRPSSQIMRGKHHHQQQQQQQPQQQQKKRRLSSEKSDNGVESRQHRLSVNGHQHHQRQQSNSPDDRSSVTRKQMASIDEDQLQDIARTYTGLDKRISEEFISIAMDPERKFKTSSHHGSEK